MRIGTKVRWTSSNTDKVGEIVAVVPAGKMPRDVGYPKIDHAGMHRDHDSFVVIARKPKFKNGEAVPGPKAAYWPRVSLLKVFA